MAIDEAESAESGDIGDPEDSDEAGEATVDVDDPVAVGRYTWADFVEDHGHEDAVSDLYPQGRPPAGGTTDVGLSSGEDVDYSPPTGSDWDRTSFDPVEYLGFHPDDLADRITDVAGPNAKLLQSTFEEFADPETTPVAKDEWMWEHFKWEYYYDDDGSRPRTSDGDIDRFDPEEYLSFDPDEVEGELARAGEISRELDRIVEERTVDVQEDVDEDDFFSDEYGNTTVVNRYDLEKAVPMAKKTHFVEENRYWVNKPYSFVILFHSRKENEKKYYAVEPHLNDIESDIREFLIGKLRTAIKYADEEVAAGADSTEDERREVIERETKRLLSRYDLFEARIDEDDEAEQGLFSGVLSMFGDDDEETEDDEEVPEPLDGLEVRPEPAVLADDPDTLSEYQIEKLLYLLKRDFIGYERIDPIKHDINVEDISCDGYNSPVFVYHTDYEQIISNVYHDQEELDDFVVKLAQRSGKGISKRRPQVDATLPDGSRAQLTLGREVSDHGTNYTIRQFKDVPFTPIDLINWNTFSLEEMAFLWLCIENHKSLIFAGGTASGKTTSLNAVSLFIPSNTKIVSIEDTREVELPQRNWIASVTRPSFSEDDQGDVDEFDLLEAALRQRPDYIVMGEIRGEEGRTLFQVMSTGHTTYTTFHADSVGEVLKRFTTDPINVSKTMFTALDLVSIQTQTRVHGHKVRRNKTLTEVNHYDAENDEINVQDVYQWQAETDEFLKLGESNTLEEIKFDRGWTQERLDEELFKREVILAYLIKNGLNQYREVAATIQAYINDPETILTLIANGQLEDSLEDLREMESVLIDVDPAKEELVPRPDPDDEGYNLAMNILEEADESLFDEYRGREVEGLESALDGVAEPEPSVEAEPDEISFEGEVADGFDTDFTFGGDSGPFGVDEDDGADDSTAAAAAEADDDPSDDGAESDEPADDEFTDGPGWLSGDDEGTEDMWAEAREALEDDPTPSSELPEESVDAAELDEGDRTPASELPGGSDEEADDAAAEADDEEATPTPPELEEGDDTDEGDATDGDRDSDADASTDDAGASAPTGEGASDAETGEPAADSVTTDADAGTADAEAGPADAGTGSADAAGDADAVGADEVDGPDAADESSDGEEDAFEAAETETVTGSEASAPADVGAGDAAETEGASADDGSATDDEPATDVDGSDDADASSEDADEGASDSADAPFDEGDDGGAGDDVPDDPFETSEPEPAPGSAGADASSEDGPFGSDDDGDDAADDDTGGPFSSASDDGEADSGGASTGPFSDASGDAGTGPFSDAGDDAADDAAGDSADDPADATGPFGGSEGPFEDDDDVPFSGGGPFSEDGPFGEDGDGSDGDDEDDE